MRGDLRPDLAEPALHVAVAAGDQIPLLDPARPGCCWRSSSSRRPWRRIDEAEARVGLLQVAVAGAVDHAARGCAAAVGERDVRAVGLLSADVRVDLRDAHAGRAGVGDGRHLERAGARPRAAHAALADGRERRGRRSRSPATSACPAGSAHGGPPGDDERSAVARLGRRGEQFRAQVARIGDLAASSLPSVTAVSGPDDVMSTNGTTAPAGVAATAAIKQRAEHSPQPASKDPQTPNANQSIGRRG